ncbi:lipid A 3-O-deacylase PagL [Marinirhabdus gelatinilytica]|uniref:Lipid A 3-O-deacylase PagL n=2 Tax=Marinirhabdus gelatinilytica TaxID=1703343 RepID=A0A370QGA1_9FLAO|nr:lipid A 3-O-deacylase PagL [Marinirhabdus gelatinilytica]
MKKLFLAATMKQPILLLLLCVAFQAMAQTETVPKGKGTFITPEILAGITAESNTDFPESSSTIGLYVNFGKDQRYNSQQWAYRLGFPKTGIALGVVDYGNTEFLGQAYTLLPNVEFNILGRERRNFTMNVGLGASYFNKTFSETDNMLNQAVSTHLTWTFRLLFQYKIFETKGIDWRLGGGYLHHSNGHTRLPNNGYNSLVGSVSGVISTSKKSTATPTTGQQFERSSFYYLSPRVGYGINTLSLVYNDKKPVYTVAISAGKQINNTFKYGVGVSYRYYQHYYDYIVENESLVQEGREFENLKDNPTWSASNITLFAEGELLLNHIGLTFMVGANIHKPAYDIDWRINQGWDNTPRDIPENWMLGEYNSKYKLKKAIATRLGLRYYLFGNENNPSHNIYAGASINANLGQADFTEFSIGYVYLLKR